MIFGRRCARETNSIAVGLFKSEMRNAKSGRTRRHLIGSVHGPSAGIRQTISQ